MLYLVIKLKSLNEQKMLYNYYSADVPLPDFILNCNT
jgi:hypothetical protein